PGPRPLDVEERRRRFVGSPAASFTVGELLSRALPEEMDQINVRVLDVSDGGEQLLFGPARAAGELPGERREVDFAGRRWRLELVPLPAFSQSLQVIPLISFGFGAVASLLLAALFFNVARTRETALDLAD